MMYSLSLLYMVLGPVQGRVFEPGKVRLSWLFSTCVGGCCIPSLCGQTADNVRLKGGVKQINLPPVSLSFQDVLVINSLQSLLQVSPSPKSILYTRETLKLKTLQNQSSSSPFLFPYLFGKVLFSLFLPEGTRIYLYGTWGRQWTSHSRYLKNLTPNDPAMDTPTPTFFFFFFLDLIPMAHTQYPFA